MSAQASPSTRILFVDDSKVMLKTAAKILKAEFDVITAVDGNDAWAKLEKDHDIQVLFTDINMPDCDGYELLKFVRTSDDPGLNAMPVILVTGADDDQTARQTALDRGATDFINKKSLGEELLPRARAHARYQRISRQLQARSTIDPVTGLANEHGLVDRLEQDIAYARRHEHELALIRIEIDHLVALYEARGNQVVEPIVIQVADLIRSRIRKEDTAAHIGLGGFAISVPGGQLQGVEAMATWLREHAQAMSLDIDGHQLGITLTTAVVGNAPDIWVNAADALARSQAAIDHARQQAARERARRKAEEQATREQAQRLAEERAAQEQARRRAEERAAAEQAQRLAEEQAAREQARRQAEELAARGYAQRKAQEQAAREQAQEQAARERARREAEERAAREQAQAAERERAAAAARAPAPSPRGRTRVFKASWPQRLFAFLRDQGSRFMRLFRRGGR